MDLKQKLEYQDIIDSYIQDHEIYELFQNCIAGLIIDKPEAPIDYLIEKLSKPDHRRIIIIGSSGRVRKEVSKEIASRLHIRLISAGDLLKEEVERNGKYASKIYNSWKEGVYVKDSIVLDVVLPVIEQYEIERNSYIIEGIPRTLVQAISLQRAGIVPERVIVLNTSSNFYKTGFNETFAQFSQGDYESASELAYQEYSLGLKGVLEEYAFLAHQIPPEEDPSVVAETAYKLVIAKGKGAFARKPLKILVIGGPLSGKTTQAEMISKKYGLTLIVMKEIIDKAISNKTEVGNTLSYYINNSQTIPDKLIIELLRDRLDSTDCKVNGWILDGFPNTFEQCRALKYLKQSPSNVFFLEASDTMIFERASFRKIDPKTGKIYGKDHADIPGLVSLPEDDDENIRNRLHLWREETIKMHAEFSKIGKSLKAEMSTRLILDSISDTLETSIPNETS